MGLTAQERMARGQAAEMLLKSDMFTGVAMAVDKELRDQIFATKAHEASQRELLHAEYRGFTALMQRLRRYVEDGQLAAQEAAQKQTRP